MSLALWGLFSSAFISATLMPGGSEAVLAYLISQQNSNLAVLVLVATVGNTLGSLTSYGIGYFAQRHKSPEQLLGQRQQRVLRWMQTYGVWSLLLAWLPVVGDAIPLLAGWFRYPILLSSLLIFIGKLLRYCLVAAATVGVIHSL